MSVRSFHRPFLCALVLGAGLVLAAGAASDDDSPSTPHPRKKKTTSSQSTPRPNASPSAHKRANDDDDAGSAEKPAGQGTPRPHGSPAARKKTSADDESGPAKPAATPGKKGHGEEDAEASGQRPAASTGGSKNAPGAAPSDTEANPSGEASKYAPSASIASSELTGFSEQPPKVKQLIESALALAKLNLIYKFGSDDPANGGMDCSGTVAYLLRQQGFTDVPRDASGQYTWVRKKRLFYAVISKKAGGFEFADLLPGDLMFWNGTYNAERDPPVTHSMIYLGVERKRKQPVMWGSSDGRTYDGKQRYGVSVFDFRMPKTDTLNATGHQTEFLGYARIPGLREGTE